ncbi:MAG: 4Fe-4S dicluster domain-containing protein [Chloroflexota bacterium]|nr:4Fe-4S dicluster domain-containing protein [Chloroflexota bacterium]
MANHFSRRQFLKLGALVAGGMATLGAARSRALDDLTRVVGETAAQIPAFRAHAQTTGELVGTDGEPMAHGHAAPAAPGKHRWVMVIDLAKCDGCKECTQACSAMHFVPPGQEWIKVFETRDNNIAGAYWFPRPCMQCDNTPCAKVCPVGATMKREDGIVLIDQDRCIGCRYCIAACPYGSRFFNWAEPPHTPAELAQSYSVEWNYPHRKGVVEKCIFCPANAREGKLPACASACRMGAIYFGDQLEDAVTNHDGETVSFKQLIREKGGFRYMEELGTEPRVWYLPPRDRVYPAPKG